MNNQDYKNDALRALKGNWAPSILASVVYLAIMLVAMLPYVISTNKLSEQYGAMVTDPAMAMEYASRTMQANGLMFIVMLILAYPAGIGLMNAFKKLLREGDSNVTGNMFSIAITRYGRNIWTMFLMGLFISLWSLLFIIPGIIASFSYAMAPFLLHDNPEISGYEAIRRSKAMVKGHKFDLFYLLLSFIGWGILCLFTFGIGYLWLMPYMQTSVASFYDDIKADFGEGFDAEIKMSM
jgi:uncharacterized membrane protein